MLVYDFNLYSRKNTMLLKIEPTSELSIILGGKRIGKLDGLTIDISKPTGMFIALPKVKLSIVIDANAFAGNEKKLEELSAKAREYKFLDVTIYK